MLICSNSQLESTLSKTIASPTIVGLQINWSFWIIYGLAKWLLLERVLSTVRLVHHGFLVKRLIEIDWVRQIFWQHKADLK